jgi:hypothetical protein
LNRLLSLRDEGLTRPFAVPSKTAEAFVTAERSGQDGAAAALREWKSDWTRYGWVDREDAEPEHKLVFGRDLPLDGMRRDAARLWDPLCSRERLETA